MERIELLAPAKDLPSGRLAIDCGADAVYIGAPQFGARARADNSLEDIAALVAYAHVYWARVYVTVNTLLYDHELSQAVRLIHQLDEIGVDAVIVQDVGLLECDLPPIPLIASTQMHNHTPERVAFLEQVGFQRAILARELSLAQIRAIRQQTSIELEAFVHGALCVCYSGQCYMSYAVGGRSGNRGVCAQPCRRRYRLVDAEGDALIEDRYLLSLCDLKRIEHLDELLDAGVASFKIEGRLKDELYVKNVVSVYNRRVERLVAARGIERSSSGRSRIDFQVDLQKTFNRGYTDYFLHGRAEPPGSIDTPKMRGEPIGRVERVDRRTFTMAPGAERLQNGDGISFFDEAGELQGTRVNVARGRVIEPDDLAGIRPGLMIYRNHNHAFLSQLGAGRAERTIGVTLTLGVDDRGFTLTAVDEDSNAATRRLDHPHEEARKPEQAVENARQQLSKTGETPFACQKVVLDWPRPYFLPFSALNALRRRTLDALEATRLDNRPVIRRAIVRNDVPYPEKPLSYRANALNKKAVAFYRRHDVEEIEPAAESGLDMRDRCVMRTRYCPLDQLGLCGERAKLQEPLYLVDEDGHRYRLRLDCAACEMEVFY